MASLPKCWEKSVDHDNVKGFGGRETRSEERVINNDQ